MCARSLIGALGAVLLLGSLATRAAADDIMPTSEAGALITESGDPAAFAGETAAQSSSGGSGDPALSCEWVVFVENDHEFHIYEDEGVPRYSETGRWLRQVCRNTTTGAVFERIVPDNGVDPAVVAQQALSSVSIPAPVIRTSPAAETGLYVRVPTWLWVDSAWWTPYSATATAGGVTATVVATPARVTWEAGDGATVLCSGPGVAWSAGMPEGATDCSHIYTSASSTQPEGTYRLTATVELEVRWTSNVGASGSLGAISRSSSETVRVGEIQAIETR